jgi:DNA-binding NarL/FixJ family response regulator
VVDENRENRVRRYLDRLSTRSQSQNANHRRYPLTDREKEILQLLAEDKSLHTIADDLYLSYATVRNHVQHILHKLGVHSILEAVAVYLLSED